MLSIVIRLGLRSFSASQATSLSGHSTTKKRKRDGDHPGFKVAAPGDYCAAIRWRTLPSMSSRPAGIGGNHLTLAITSGGKNCLKALRKAGLTRSSAPLEAEK